MPAPLGPIRPRISPRLMLKVTESSAVSPPNFTVTSLQLDQRFADLGVDLPGGRDHLGDDLGVGQFRHDVGDVDRDRVVEDDRSDRTFAVGVLRHVQVFLADLGAGLDTARDRARTPNRGSLGHLRLLFLDSPTGRDVQLADRRSAASAGPGSAPAAGRSSAPSGPARRTGTCTAAISLPLTGMPRISVRPRKKFGRYTMMNAPRMTPSLLPWPPSTTAHRNSTELTTLKLVGTTNCT